METRIVRYANQGLQITVEGEYENRGWSWVLVRWRIGSTYNGHKSAGSWHKIHGNQKKDLGELKLYLDEIPLSAPDPFNYWPTASVDTIAKAQDASV